MKDLLLDLSQCHGLGDLLSATPVIRKLASAHGKKLTVVSPMPEVFKYHPDVEQSLPSRWFDATYGKDEFIYYNSFHSVGQKNAHGVEMKHNAMDIRQFNAANLGFQLREDELKLDFYLPESLCDKAWTRLHYEFTDAFARPYIVIHPMASWRSRTWNHWDEFIKLFCEKYPQLNIIAIGKTSKEHGWHEIFKNTLLLDSSKIFDLRDKTTLYETYCILSQASCIYTMDSGILHLAATTESPIVQIGSSIHPSYRKVIRNNFLYSYIGGACKKFCASDMSYGVKEWGTIQGVPPLVDCLEKYPTFECHPSAEKVFNNGYLVKHWA